MTIWELNGTRVFEIDAEGPLLGSDRSASDLIGETYGHEIDLIAIPAERLSPEFLQLRTGMAGSFLQKVITYGLRIVIVGDISAASAASRTLRDFVAESNRAGQVLFVPDTDALRQRL